jgi:uncharacterized protein
MAYVIDSISVASQRTTTREGFLRAPAIIGRAGILEYKNTDSAVATAPIDLLSSGRKIRVLRPEAEVFKPESMETFAGRPVLNEHSTAKVTPDNYRQHLVGATGTSVVRDGDALRADLIVYDADTIAEINAGKAQLSQGYDATPVWTPGKDPVHGEYDGIFTNILGNHIAVTLEGRSGPEVRICDSKTGEKTVKRTINGIEIDIHDSAVSIVDSLLSEVATKAKDLDEAKGKIAVLAKQVEDNKVEIARVTDSTYVDGRVRDRALLCDAAKRVAPAVVCDGLSDDAIRAACVAARGIKVDGEAAIRGAFAALSVQTTETVSAQVADALQSGSGKKTPDEMYREARAASIAKGSK